MNIQKILLPVDFPNTSLRVVHQAAVLAHHFHSEIVMLRVMTARNSAGVPGDPSEIGGQDLLAEIIREAEKSQDRALRPGLEGLAIRSVLGGGDPARTIVQTAQVEKADLIMMASHGSTFNRFLLGSVTANVLQGTECPVWTGGHLEEPEGPSTPDFPLLRYGAAGIHDRELAEADGQEMRQQPGQGFAIHNVLCAVDLGPRSDEAVSWAGQMAAEFG